MDQILVAIEEVALLDSGVLAIDDGANASEGEQQKFRLLYSLLKKFR